MNKQKVGNFLLPLVVHRKYFSVNNRLVSLVELLLEAEENFLLSVFVAQSKILTPYHYQIQSPLNMWTD